MNFKYVTKSENGDATTSYSLEGKYPVKFRDFFNWVLKKENSFSIEFDIFNAGCEKCIEVSKSTENGKCYWADMEHKNIFEEIADKNIIRCGANGGWGQMTYFCHFEE